MLGDQATRPAHPRSRGENNVFWSANDRTIGSSPLTRGKRPEQDGQAGACGLIPAHAGKTTPCASEPSNLKAHPRSRGENVGLSGVIAKVEGSSPLTRGKPPVTVLSPKTARLIPAHAGKTTRSQPAATSPTGSSPLTRGKRGRRPGWRRTRRLIPAHAGKTLPDLRFYCADRSDLGNP